MIARVSLEIALRREFDYAIPPELAGKVDVGSRVQVPFGPRKILGVVTAVAEESGQAKLKPIIKIIGTQTLVTPKVLKLARWIGEYYCCAPEIALKSVLPEAVRNEDAGWRERLFVRVLPINGEFPKLPKRQQDIWNIIEERREILLSELVELAETTAATVRKLEDRGLIEITSEISERDPYAHEHILPSQPLALNPAQAKALEQITRVMDEKGGTGFQPVVSGILPETGEAQTPASGANANSQAMPQPNLAGSQIQPGGTGFQPVVSGILPETGGAQTPASDANANPQATLQPNLAGSQIQPGGTGFQPVVSGILPEIGEPQTPASDANANPQATPQPNLAGSQIQPAGSRFHPVTEATARRRNLPHFEVPGFTYHVTWRTHNNLMLPPDARAKALDACHFWHGKKIRCYAACVMPDHIHLLIQPLPVQEAGKEGVYSLTEILHSIKSYSANEINKVMGRKGPVWQQESYDRMIRSESDLHEKWNYLWNNPREIGLVGPMEEYPYIWTPGGTGFQPVVSGRMPETGEAQTPALGANANPQATPQPNLAGSQIQPAGSRLHPDAAQTSTSGANANSLATPQPNLAGSQIQPAGSRFHPGTFLLHGVTGSGKTEIYLQAIAHALEQGKGAIVLVPEISLTPQTVERFKARFSSGKLQTLVAVLHSHLSAGERHDEWHKIRQGRARIVIGARSAIFAPVEPLGLIIVDEEHEHTYKQEESPRYHARDVAVMRGLMENAVVVLGSATPSLESYYNCKRGKFGLLELPQRVDDQKMPRVRVVDMRQSKRDGKGPPIFSPQLKEAILQRLERKEQTILFLNRRGYSSSLVCEKCGHVCGCPNCSLALTYHRPEQVLRCHICGYNERVPQVCPNEKCKNPGIRYSGLGTQKVEDVLGKLFPHARVRRMDADVMKRKDDYRQVLGEFRAGKIDILVGTQMIAKGLHFPNVTLVGIIFADMALHQPDFRAGERTFQLLTQVAGRAGRGDIEGEVFVQAFTPFHPAIQYARRHDFVGFYEQEIEFREQLKYPPAGRVALLTLKGRNEDKVKFSAEHVKREVEAKAKGSKPATSAEKTAMEGDRGISDLIIAGPAPAPLLKAENYYRYHILLRTRAMTRLSQMLAHITAGLTLPDDVTLAVDIDPVDLS